MRQGSMALLLGFARTATLLLSPASASPYAVTPAELRDALRCPELVYTVTSAPSIVRTTRMVSPSTSAIPSSFVVRLTVSALRFARPAAVRASDLLEPTADR